MSPFRERCVRFLASCDGPPTADELMAFVTAETGRKADSRLEYTLPLCLYFATKTDREDFVTLIQVAKPTLVMKRLP